VTVQHPGLHKHFEGRKNKKASEKVALIFSQISPLLSSHVPSSQLTYSLKDLALIFQNCCKPEAKKNFLTSMLQVAELIVHTS